MVTKFTIKQEPGFYLDKDKATMPKCSGIYVVYKCDYNSYYDTVDIDEILYIGESQNIYECFNGTKDNPNTHECYNDFVEKAGGAQHICYGIIPVNEYPEEQRGWIQDALIYSQKPIINALKKKKNYPHPAVEITLKEFPDCWNTSHIFLSSYN